MPMLDHLRGRMPDVILGTHTFRGQDTVVLKRSGILEFAGILKAEPSVAFDILMDLTCVDYLRFGRSQSSSPTLTTPSPLPYYMKPKAVPETWERGEGIREYRFEVVYHFFSTRHSHRLRVKVPLNASDPTVDSLTGLWSAANWFEREVWDMFGVTFTGHPNLKRIMMYEAFDGHPLRKDYPYYKRQPIIGPVN